MNKQLLITFDCKKKVIIKTRTLVKKAEHTDTFLMAGKPFYVRECYHKGRLKIISIYNPTVLVVSHVSHSNQVSKVSLFSDEIITN